MTSDDALRTLADSTADAIAQVLEMLSSTAPERSPASFLPAGTPPLRGIVVPAVVASVSYVDGVTGGNIFVMTRTGVQRLAAAMMGMDPMAVEETEELSELDLSAAGEAMNQMMAAAAGATSTVLGQEVDISPPETRVIAEAEEAVEAFDAAPHMTNVSFTLLGEPCRLIQLVPNAFIVRMTRALSELAAEAAGGRTAAAEAAGVPGEALRGVPVRVWAELGRTRMPVEQAVALPPGALVDLDAAPEEAINLYVNGRRFATGRLLLADGEWAVRIESVLTPT